MNPQYRVPVRERVDMIERNLREARILLEDVTKLINEMRDTNQAYTFYGKCIRFVAHVITLVLVAVVGSLASHWAAKH